MDVKFLTDTMKENRVPRLAGAGEVLSTAVTAQVDTTPQILRPIIPFSAAKVLEGASELSANALLVLNDLLSCFKKEKYVKEGALNDLIWGFVDVCGRDPTRVAHGLVDLKRAGYVGFRAPDGAEVDEHCTRLNECFVFYTQRLTDLVCSN